MGYQSLRYIVGGQQSTEFASPVERVCIRHFGHRIEVQRPMPFEKILSMLLRELRDLFILNMRLDGTEMLLVMALPLLLSNRLLHSYCRNTLKNSISNGIESKQCGDPGARIRRRRSFQHTSNAKDGARKRNSG